MPAGAIDAVTRRPKRTSKLVGFAGTLIVSDNSAVHDLELRLTPVSGRRTAIVQVQLPGQPFQDLRRIPISRDGRIDYKLVNPRPDVDNVIRIVVKATAHATQAVFRLGWTAAEPSADLDRGRTLRESYEVIVDDINAFRAAHGLPPVELNLEASLAAQELAELLAAERTEVHGNQWLSDKGFDVAGGCTLMGPSTDEVGGGGWAWQLDENLKSVAVGFAPLARPRVTWRYQIVHVELFDSPTPE